MPESLIARGRASPLPHRAASRVACNLVFRFARGKSASALAKPPFDLLPIICVAHACTSFFTLMLASYQRKHVLSECLHGECLHLTQTPKTLTEAIRYYSNVADLHRRNVAALRWPDGKPVCPKCNAVEGGTEALLAGHSEAVEVLFVPKAVFGEGWELSSRILTALARIFGWSPSGCSATAAMGCRVTRSHELQASHKSPLGSFSQRLRLVLKEIERP